MERPRAGRIGIYGAILFLFFIEAAIPPRFGLFGARPELLLIATIFFGFHFGALIGAEAGIFCGILKDILSVGNFGINTISFLFIGFLSGYLRKKLFKENFIAQFFFSCLGVYLISGVYFLNLDRFAGSDTGAEFWNLVFYKGLYTGVLAPFLFFVLARAFKK